MAFDTIIRNGTIVTASEQIRGDIGIEGGIITSAGRELGGEKTKREIDATGNFILPGLIDVHVHLRDPGFTQKEDWATGSQAAAAGGVTTVLEMPNTNPPTTTLEVLSEKRKLAASKSLVNFGLYMGFTGENGEEIKRAKNIAGVKVFLSETAHSLPVQNLQKLGELFAIGKLVVVHAEDPMIIQENTERYHGTVDPKIHSLIRNHRSAYEATKAVLHLAKKHEARVHITHITTKEEVEEIQKFRSPRVSCDVTPHHLFLTEKAYADRGNYVKVNPPLRTDEDRQSLWKGILRDVIPVIASDHAPHLKEEKEKGYWQAPAGVPGLETLLPLLLDSVNHGELSLSDVVRLTSANPAKLFGIAKKGDIQVGFDADLTIVDMELVQEVGAQGFFTKCGWSPFSGWKLQGWPVMTIVNGQIVFENGQIHQEKRGKEVSFERENPL